MLSTPATMIPVPNSTPLPALLLVEVVEDDTFVQPDEALAGGTVKLADKVKSAHCHNVRFNNHIHKKNKWKKTAYLVEITVTAIEENLDGNICAILNSGHIHCCGSDIDRETVQSLPALLEEWNYNLITRARIKIAKVIWVLICRDENLRCICK